MYVEYVISNEFKHVVNYMHENLHGDHRPFYEVIKKFKSMEQIIDRLIIQCQSVYLQLFLEHNKCDANFFNNRLNEIIDYLKSFDDIFDEEINKLNQFYLN